MNEFYLKSQQERNILLGVYSRKLLSVFNLKAAENISFSLANTDKFIFSYNLYHDISG